MKKKTDMKEEKLNFAFILFIALTTLILVNGKAHADVLIEQINSLIDYFNKPAIKKSIVTRYTGTKFHLIIRKAARRYRLDPHLIESIIKVESNFNPRAVSSKGAMGLMQLMPETAREIGVTKAFDPHQNIMGGAYYYRRMLKRFGNHRTALYAYNCGPECAANGGIPGETRRYANNVIREYKNLKQKEKRNEK